MSFALGAFTVALDVVGELILFALLELAIDPILTPRLIHLRDGSVAAPGHDRRNLRIGDLAQPIQDLVALCGCGYQLAPGCVRCRYCISAIM